MTPLTETAAAAFLEALGATGCVKTAAGIAGASRDALYAHRRASAAFAAAWTGAVARWSDRQLRTIEAATAPSGEGKPGDWKAAAWLLDRQERRREGAAKLALLRAQTKQAELRNAGTLPADNLNVRVAVDPAALAAKIDALAARVAAAPAADDAGADPAAPE